MKKVSKIALFALLLAFIAVLFTSCNPAKLEKITGTYVLVEQTKQLRTEEEATDLLAQNQIVSYIVLDGSDFALYVYQDKDTPLTCQQLAVTYTKNDKDKVSYIDFSDKLGYSSYGVSFGLYVDYSTDEGCFLRKESTHIAKVNYTTNVKYERVSDVTDISYASQQMGQTLSYCAYDVYPFTGINVLSYAQPNENNLFDDPYVYYIADIDGITRQATIYSMLKSDLEHPSVKTVPFTYEYDADPQTGVETYGTFSLDGKTYQIGFGCGLYIDEPAKTNDLGIETVRGFMTNYRNSKYFTIDSLIQDAVSYYNSQTQGD